MMIKKVNAQKIESHKQASNAFPKVGDWDMLTKTCIQLLSPSLCPVVHEVFLVAIIEDTITLSIDTNRQSI
jgi:hypothetical protein